MVNRTISSGGFIAELYYDPKAEPQLFHYIVTRKDSAEILAWGQEYSAEDAERAAFDQVTTLSRAAKAAG